MKAGDLIRIVTTGGGGWGDPLERETTLVREDVAWGKVSPEGARRDYGVAFSDKAALTVDEKATAELRGANALRAGRSPLLRPRAEFQDAQGSGEGISGFDK